MMTNSSNILEPFNIIESEKEVPVRGKALVKFNSKGDECYSDLKLYEVQTSLLEAFLHNQMSWKRNK